MLEALAKILQELPPVVDGFIGGILAYTTIYLVHKNWQIIRRNKSDKLEQ